MVVIAAAAGGLAGFAVSFIVWSLISGGRRIFSIYALLLAGTIVQVTPRRFLPDRFVWWYNDALRRV